MNIKPNRAVRVGTKMTRSGEAGDVTLPSAEQYAAELQGMTDAANGVRTAAPAKVRPTAPSEKPASTAKKN